MKKIDLNRLDLSLYTEKLPNGLEIYVIPMQNRKNIYASFTTKFGSKDSSFIPLGESEYLTVNDGIAHFLEHKLFAAKDGIDPMSFFAANGASNNAGTNHNSTMYIFDGPNHFKENMNFLLDFVQEPHFTDENVLKEKGIIEEELKMYHDDPISKLVETAQYNTFINHPIRLPIGGTIESIYKITKEELYRCYHTFYHPSNMYVVITGNVDPLEAINIIKNNQVDKEFDVPKKIEIMPIIEPNEVFKSFEEVKMDIKLSKVAISFKFNYEGIDLRDFLVYVAYFFTNKFGETSLFRSRMLEEGILTDSLDFYSINNDKHFIKMILAETKYPEKLIEYIKEELANKDFTSDDLDRRKKVSINKLINNTDDIFSMNEIVINSMALFDKVYTDNYDYTLSLNLADARKVIDRLDFSNHSVVIVKPLIDNAN